MKRISLEMLYIKAEAAGYMNNYKELTDLINLVKDMYYMEIINQTQYTKIFNYLTKSVDKGIKRREREEQDIIDSLAQHMANHPINSLS